MHTQQYYVVYVQACLCLPSSSYGLMVEDVW